MRKFFLNFHDDLGLGQLGAQAFVLSLQGGQLSNRRILGLAAATHDVYRAYHEGWEPERAEGAFP